MSLPAEQFREIIRSLKSDGASRRAMEKRCGPRVGLRSRLSIRFVFNGRPEPVPTMVWLRDLSVSGIGLVHSEMMENGQEFIAEFPLRNSNNLLVKYRAVHSKLLAKNLYSIGGTLEKIMSDDGE